ncbi:hypothetical protein [Paenibacillus sp. Z3-2]
MAKRSKRTMVEVEMEDMLFIYNEDFDLIRPALDRMFPLTDPRSGEEKKELDPCWDNPVMKEVWVEVPEESGQQVVAEPELRVFLDQFTTWVRTHLQLAEGIEVTGNL